MKSRTIPITDDHIHIDPINGRGLEAVKDFSRVGGTHIFLVSKPSWSLSVHPVTGEDYARVFDETIRIAELIPETGVVAFPVLGVHPAEITHLTERMPLAAAVEIMKGGIDCAARYVREGKAVALKSGRPHYEVSPELLAASNEVLMHALDATADCGCALQVHAETGPCSDIVDMARRAGIPKERVIKHYGAPDTPLHPSLIAKHEAIPELIRSGRAFTMESDYMDENERPGAVIGPKSVPRYTNKLLESGQMTEEDCFRIHAETIQNVYGVSITLE
ncbi:TatD family hydrolase [Methanoregula sp.]|uniref:TatD family hydrolase n=1 Tax=Methanoregula sp. TaxID=2052170 RepID=UPI00237480BE|nr:TatD family hydrolase [Methanoregula sp.]MDD1686856.1 TatD family hydrolase [Methanoregula sp.]